MTIDINELREVVADCYWPTSPVAINELLDRLEAAEKETASWKGLAKQFGNEADALRAKIAEMGKQTPTAELFSWLPPGTTHISKIESMIIPCFGFKARFNAFKYVNGEVYAYRSDTDNENERWEKAAPLYKNGVIPTIYPLSGAKGG